MTIRITENTIVRPVVVFHCLELGEEVTATFDEILLSSTKQDFTGCTLSVPCRCKLRLHLIEVKAQ